MPAPPDDNQAREFLRRAKEQGIPDDIAEDTLAEMYSVSPYEQQVAEQSGATPRSRMEVAAHRAMEAEQFKAIGKGALGAAIVGGSAYLGGLPAMAAAPEGYGVLAGIGGQTLGAYGGELARQKVMGEPTSRREARKAALLTGGPALAGYGLTKYFGAAGGVPSAATEYVGARSKMVPRYDLTMREPPVGAEIALGRQVGKEVTRQAQPLTPGRIAEVGYIEQATQAGTRIDPQPVIDALKAKMLKTPRTRVGRNANRRLKELVDSLEKAKTEGGMTPSEMDELIGGELDPSIYRAGKASGQMVAGRLAPAREQAKESLLAPLPPEARMERAKAAQELGRRELAESYFGESRKGTVIHNEIKNLFQPGHEEALESLRGIGRQAGMDFETMARELATKRVFSADDRVKATMLHRIMLSIGAVGVATGRPGYAAAAVLSQPSVARTGAKLLAPLQTLIGPAGALMAGQYRAAYPLKTSPTTQEPPGLWKETQVPPEQMFPGMTNP